MIELEITILQARMEHSKADGYVGNVEFQVEHHKAPYEITLYSRDNKEWMYGLHFLHESGNEQEIFLVEDFLDENDESFDRLVQAAKEAFLQDSSQTNV